MIKGKVRGSREELTKEAVLSRISEFEVFRYFLGHDFQIGKPFESPFRTDRNPSFEIDALNIGLSYVDYGAMHIRGNCIDFVMRKENLNYNEALQLINQVFGLGIGSYEKFHIRKAPVYKVPVIEEKKPPIISVVTRKFNLDELAYWGQYGFTLETLKKGDIYVPKTIYRNREKLTIKKGDLTFCYWYDKLKLWKLYRPLKPKRGKDTPPWDWKWDSPIPFNYCDKLENIKDCQIAYLTKSRKDRILLSTLLGTECVADVQAEDPRCITQEHIDHFKAHSQIQVTVYDADSKGKESSQWMSNTYGFLHANVPDHYLKEGISDFSDLAARYGPDAVVEHFQKKNLLPNYKQTG